MRDNKKLTLFKVLGLLLKVWAWFFAWLGFVMDVAVHCKSAASKARHSKYNGTTMEHGKAKVWAHKAVGVGPPCFYARKLRLSSGDKAGWAMGSQRPPHDQASKKMHLRSKMALGPVVCGTGWSVPMLFYKVLASLCRSGVGLAWHAFGLASAGRLRCGNPHEAAPSIAAESL